MTELAALGPYRDALARHAARILPDGIAVAIHGLPSGSYRGRAPTAALSNAFAHHRILEPVLDHALRAEREGYDAFVIGSFSEPTLRELRSAVDMPVVSVTEATLLVACSIGRLAAPVANDAAIARMVGEAIRRHGLGERAQRPRWIDPPLDEFELARAFASPAPLVERFLVLARQAIAGDADVIIPAEGMLSELLFAEGVTSVDGVPVLDSFGVAWNYALLLAGLRKRSGLSVSRGWYYRRDDVPLVHALEDRATGPD